MIVYRLATLYIPELRYFILKLKAPMSCPNKIRTVVRRGEYGDWFLLMMVGTNIDALVLSDVVNKLAEKIVNPNLVRYAPILNTKILRFWV